MYAVGGNQQAAEFSGIKVEKVKFFVHAFSGLMAVLLELFWLHVCIPDSLQPVMELKWMLSPAVVVGGTSNGWW